MLFAVHALLLPLLSLLVLCAPRTSALPDPAVLAAAGNRPHNQAGFVLPPPHPQTPPCRKALAPSHGDRPPLRSWAWTHWLADARAIVRSLLRTGRRGRRWGGGTGTAGLGFEEDLSLGRFDNDIVLRVNVSSLADRLAIADLAESMILDIWSSTPTHVDIRLPKTSTKGFLSLLPKHISKKHQQIITNLRAAVDYTYPQHPTVLPRLKDLQSLTSKNPAARVHAEDLSILNDLFFSNYQPYEAIGQWLRLLEALRPELVTLVSLGKSYEGREILGISVHGNRSTHHAVRPGDRDVLEEKTMGILMHGAQHAREWISVSTVCYIASQLIAGYYVDDIVRKLVDTFEWSLFPVLNVDGYEYSWSTDRLWRKNRQPTPVPFCTGIDPDHSWDYKWDAPRSDPHSSNPCSESYRGESPFQATESKLMAKYIRSTLPDNHSITSIAYLDFHSYSQSILYPFAYNCDVLPRDAEDIAEAAWGAARAARNVHGRYFNVDSACEGDNFVLYDKVVKTSGTINGGAAVDWAYEKGAIKYSYSIKLRDTGNHGFLLPKGEIVPSGEEMFAMSVSLGEFIRKKEIEGQNP